MVLQYLNTFDINSCNVKIETQYLCEDKNLPYDMQESIPYKTITIWLSTFLLVEINYNNNQKINIKRLCFENIVTDLTLNIKNKINYLLKNINYE